MSQPRDRRPSLIQRWWVQFLVAVWILAIVIIYFRLQILRLLQIGGLKP